MSRADFPDIRKDSIMIALIQRVGNAAVAVDGKQISQIGRGFLVLLGVFEGDTEKEMRLLAKKTANLRIFIDENDRMNLSRDRTARLSWRRRLPKKQMLYTKNLWKNCARFTVLRSEQANLARVCKSLLSITVR